MAEEGNPGFDAKEIGATLLKAKASGNEISFAFGLAGKPEECGFVTDLRKGPKALKGELKALPTRFAKTCFGTFTVVENEVRLLSARPAKGIVKSLKKLFREEGMGKYKPMLVGPDGQEIDEDTLPDLPEEDEDAETTALGQGQEGQPQGQGQGQQPGQTAPQQQTAPDPAIEALRRRLAAILPKLQALPADMATKLRQACQIALQQLGIPDVAAATRTVEQVEAVLARQAQTPPTPPPMPETPAVPLAKLQEALAKAITRIKALPEGDARTMLGTLAREIAGFIRDGAVERAIAGLKTLSQDLAAAEAIGQAPETPPVDAMAIWRDAREAVDTGISQLQAALRGYDDPDLARIADMGLNGVTEGLQSGLMAALFDFQRATGENRTKAAQVLGQRAAECRKQIEGDPIIALCEDNPFGVAVSIRGPLGAALSELENLARAA
jgi:hypothetical protein